MKPTRLVLLATLATILLSACIVRSIRPFYYASDVVEVPELMGTWRSDDDETWTLEKTEDGGYLWRVLKDKTEDQEAEETVLEATFFRLGGTLFYDFQLAKDAFEDAQETFSVRVHLAARLHVANDELRIEYIPYDLVDDALKSGNLDLETFREKSDDDFVLTGSTAELQGLLHWCEAQKGCFGADPNYVTVLKRST